MDMRKPFAVKCLRSLRTTACEAASLETTPSIVFNHGMLFASITLEEHVLCKLVNS